MVTLKFDFEFYSFIILKLFLLIELNNYLNVIKIRICNLYTNINLRIKKLVVSPKSLDYVEDICPNQNLCLTHTIQL